MKRIAFSSLTLADLRSLVDIVEGGVGDYAWTRVDEVALTADLQRQVQDVQGRLVNYRTQLVNEATIWSRAIYPLLVLAEQDFVQAWAGVSLQGTYPHFELFGVTDGVLGSSLAGEVEAPYLVVLETKRGVDAPNPQFQLYGQILAAARMNWNLDQQPTQAIFGCYTIADVWTFLRAEVTNLEGDRKSVV